MTAPPPPSGCCVLRRGNASPLGMRLGTFPFPPESGRDKRKGLWFGVQSGSAEFRRGAGGSLGACLSSGFKG